MSLIFTDTEFDGFGGELISISLIREDNEAIYIVYPLPKNPQQWVAENVIPILWSIPSPMPGMAYEVKTQEEGAYLLANFLNAAKQNKDDVPTIIADWPDDIAYLCKALITGPGKMASVPALNFALRRVDAYPTRYKEAIQHNAYHDAQALRVLIMDLCK